MTDEPDEKKKVTFYRLENLEVTAVALVDRPAVNIPYLVLKRHTPDEPAAAGEEGSMTTKQKKAAGDGDGNAPADGLTLPVEVLRTLKNMGAALASFLPEDAPEGDEICAAARAFQAALGKASDTEDTSKDEPMDFRSAWEGMVVADQMWKCFMTLETVISNIARSDKTPEDKAGLFDTAITDFSTIARELLGLTKAAPADATADATAAADPPGETKKSEDGAAPADEPEVPAEQANAFLTAINDLVAEVQDLGARVAKVETGGKPPEAPAGDGAAGSTNADTASSDRPVTMAEMTKAIREAVAKARHPVFKALIPDQVPPDGEVPEGDDEPKGDGRPTYDPNDRVARQKRLRGLNAAALEAQGIPVEK